MNSDQQDQLQRVERIRTGLLEAGLCPEGCHAYLEPTGIPKSDRCPMCGKIVANNNIPVTQGSAS